MAAALYDSMERLLTKLNLRAAVANGNIEDYVELLKKKQDEWKQVTLNIAVIGIGGVGKSSFINATRGVTADDPGAAEVGCTETTSKPISYPHPNNEMLKLWDLPGVGTPNFPKETYLEKIKVERYDFFLLLSATRFTEIDKWIHNEIVDRFHKPIYYVRTKIDADVTSDKQAHPKTHKENDVLKKIREETEKNLKAPGSKDIKVFLIDNYKQQKYDFRKLQQSLIDDYPKIKREALILTLSIYSDTFIKMKAKVLRERIVLTAALSAAVATVPIAGVSIAFDMSATLTMMKFFYEQLGLDKKSLERHAQLTSSDPKELQRVVKDALGDDFVSIQGIMSFISATSGTVLLAANATEEFSRFIPLAGSVLAGAISFGGTYMVNKCILDKLEVVALEVYRCANKNVVQTDDDYVDLK